MSYPDRYRALQLILEASRKLAQHLDEGKKFFVLSSLEQLEYELMQTYPDKLEHLPLLEAKINELGEHLRDLTRGSA